RPPFGKAQAVPPVDPGGGVEPPPPRRQHTLPAVQVARRHQPVPRRGRRELIDLLQGKSLKKERKPLRGRPRTEENYPAITAALEEMLSDEVAGSPEGEHKWVRSSARKLAKRLKEEGFSVGHNTVWRLLKRLGFSMRTNVRKGRGITRDPGQRDEQLRYTSRGQDW